MRATVSESEAVRANRYTPPSTATVTKSDANVCSTAEWANRERPRNDWAHMYCMAVANSRAAPRGTTEATSGLVRGRLRRTTDRPRAPGRAPRPPRRSRPTRSADADRVGGRDRAGPRARDSAVNRTTARSRPSSASVLPITTIVFRRRKAPNSSGLSSRATSPFIANPRASPRTLVPSTQAEPDRSRRRIEPSEKACCATVTAPRRAAARAKDLGRSGFPSAEGVTTLQRNLCLEGACRKRRSRPKEATPWSI